MLTHGSLFAGIGGFDLGFERAGFRTVWQVEIDSYCRKVLEKHFPDAQRFSDIRDCRNLPWVDVVTGGFPCQDISNAGQRAGINGERSGLWSEMWRIVCEVRPRFVVVENVAALLGRGMERVLGDLASGGYDAEWDVLPASAFGAPHIRERVFILAYPSRERLEKWQGIVKDYGTEFQAIERSHLRSTWWSVESEVCRVAARVPCRMDRLKALGNAVIPQIAEWIAQRIKKQLT